MCLVDFVVVDFQAARFPSSVLTVCHQQTNFLIRYFSVRFLRKARTR